MSLGAPAPRLARIGPYAVVRELARGGMGVVYAARDPGLDREVAIKVVAPGGLDAEGLERFRREGRAAARLRHPNIVCVHAVGTLPGGAPYLVMDLVEGESLRARVRRDGPLPPAEAARLIGVMARALEHAHARGVLHRDLKPANVLLGDHAAPYLTDFGLARLADRSTRLTATGEVLGTAVYMAPEQAQGDHARVGPATDVYGLGATLYELLTGHPPFAGAPGPGVLEAVLTRAPAPPGALRQGLDPALEALVLRCLEKEPARRFASAAALAQALEAWADARPATRPRRRVPGGAALALGLLVVGVAAADAALERARREAVARGEAARTTAALAAARAGRALDARAAAVSAARARALALRTIVLQGASSARAIAALTAALEHELAPAARAELLALRARLRGRDGDDVAALADLTLAEATDARAPSVRLARWLVAPRPREGGAEGLARARSSLAELEPQLEGVDLAELHGVRAHVLVLHGEAQAAQAEADRALALAPGTAKAFEVRATARGQLDDVNGALQDAIVAARLSRGSPGAETVLAVASLRAGELDRARAAVDAALDRRDTPAVRALRARIRLEAGDAAGALADAEQALLAAPDDLSTQRVRARATAQLDRDAAARAALVELARHGEPQAAESALTRALTTAPDDLELRAWRAMVRAQRLDDLAAARADAEDVLRRAPEDALASLALGFVAAREDGPAEAGPLVTRVLALRPDLAEAHLLLGRTRLLAGDVAGARQAAEEALRLDPDLSTALVLRGSALQAQDLEAAEADLERATDMAPWSPLAWNLLVRVRATRRDEAGALEAAERCLALNADDRDSLLVRGGCRFDRGDLVGALEDFDRLLWLRPRDPATETWRLEILVRLGRLDEVTRDGEALLNRLPLDHDKRPWLVRTLEEARRARGR